jgi:CRISPR-associated protein Cas5h
LNIETGRIKMADTDLIVFDIFADFAHFKRPYTTTSPVTFPIPSKPTLYGMISAIIGLDKDHYLEQFYNCGAKVAIRIKNPVHKTYIAENLINTKEGMAKIKNRTQVKIEFLKNVAYRIYVSHPQEDISSRLLQNLKAHKAHYTFSMGLSECIGNFEFVGQFQSISRNNNNSSDYIEIHSVIPTASLIKDDDTVIKFEPKKEIFRVSLTAEMNTQREIQQMTDIVFERNGRPIRAKVNSYEEIPGLKENILLF